MALTGCAFALPKNTAIAIEKLLGRFFRRTLHVGSGSGPSGPPDRPLVTVKPCEWLWFKDKPRRVLGVVVYLATGEDGRR